MIRTFVTHQIRPHEELTGKIWEFIPCQGEHANQIYHVLTPCCTESHPDFTAYRGEGKYRTTFHASGNIRLEFKGVSHTATIFLDGKKIAHHYNAYTIFSTIVTGLSSGEHTLEIISDNRFSPKSALHIPNDYMSYGGVTRPVVLEKIQDAYIKYVHVTPHTAQGKWNATVELCIENISSEEKLLQADISIDNQTAIFDEILIPPKGEKIIQKEMIFEDIKTWTPDSPTLYFVTGKLYQDDSVVDDLIDRFGFREISIEGKNILLNQEKIKIKGLCRHEDHPQFGCALPPAAIATDIELIQNLGANSIRTAHYPNDEIFLDLCDELGILVWEENHARGLSLEDMQNPNFEPQAEAVIQEMIPAHYNHPSIYIWGILNECASDSEYGRSCYEKQFSLIKKLDTSRPHSFASCKFKTDICFDLPDVVSYNIYPLWYHDTPVKEYLDDLYTWIQQSTGGAGKPFMITEIGAGGIYGYRAPHEPKWSEEYQAKTLKEQLTAVLDYPDCMGVYIWQFCDIRISDEWFGGRPRTMNNKGIVDEYRRRKLCYSVVKEIFQKNK